MKLNTDPEAKKLAIQFINVYNRSADQIFYVSNRLYNSIDFYGHTPSSLSEEQKKKLLWRDGEYEHYKMEAVSIAESMAEIEPKLLPVLQDINNPFERLVEYEGNAWAFVVDSTRIIPLLMKEYNCVFQQELISVKD